jgi:outer membrane protein OmpA-like peptidoglycan-associated protein
MKQLFNLLILSIFTIGGVNAQSLRTKNLGPKVNSIHHEIRPIVSEDGGVLFFTVEGNPKNRKGQDIWMSIRTDSGWREAERLPDYINSQKYNGVYWCSPDGRRLLLRGTYQDNTRGFSMTERRDGRWVIPSPITVKDYSNMSRGIYTGATLSPDEKTLIMYFSDETNSDINDLWISKLDSTTGEYSTPVKLNISREDDDEISPYISPDNKTLFFASDRRGGFGSFDIWMTKRLDSTWMNWSDPVNIGAPFNTRGWDAYFSIGDNGLIGYSSSNRKHSLPSDCGGADIVSDTLADWLQPEKPVEPIHDTVYIYIHDTTTITIPCNSLDTMNNEQLKEKLKHGRILFDFGRSDLRSDAYTTLDIVAELMKRNPNMTIEVGGNTDAIGVSIRNQKQSDERAQSAKSYLISKGISNNRIAAKGYSNTRPVANNKTDEGRQLNRRVDIIVISE